MHALVSTLPEPFYTETLLLWDELEARFGVRYVRVTPIPHFTWQIADRYDLSTLVPALDQYTRARRPLQVKVKGVGTFEGQEDVVFLKVQRHKDLLRCHQQVWELLGEHSDTINPLYSPETWIPHVTLAMHDIPAGKLAEIRAFVRAKQVDWEIDVENFDILTQEEGGVAERTHRFIFGEGLVLSQPAKNS